MHFVMFTMLRVFVRLSYRRKFVLRSAYIVRKSYDCHKIVLRFIENLAPVSHNTKSVWY